MIINVLCRKGDLPKFRQLLKQRDLKLKYNLRYICNKCYNYGKKILNNFLESDKYCVLVFMVAFFGPCDHACRNSS